MIDAYQKRYCPSVLYGIVIVGFQMYLYVPMIHVESGFAPNYPANSATEPWMGIRKLVDDEVALTWPRATRSLNSSVGVAQQDADMERPQCIRCRILPTRSYTDFTGHHEIESPIQLRSADRVGETLPYISFFDSPASSNLCSNHRVGGTPRLPAAGQCPTDVRPPAGPNTAFQGIRSIPAAHSGGMLGTPLQLVGIPSSPSLLMPPLESLESPVVDIFSGCIIPRGGFDPKDRA
ncbi:uncharacterized protein EI90DRAFT_3087483 [Cantharellus anzutake]|uniref:uncharacterized protein n=1 Tax=Cantharellus anzutake TaxID=1750568 RepID=UPI0019032C2B|nr:uncharacterized protein EI90DRAFT_3087483 [Cantharellus anzutake]KAF8315793.1 hypothetical protein EI90DRAFT_3087483 [Cantharellus anzutake]